MAYINDLDINITLETKAIQAVSFNLPLIFGTRADKHALADKHLLCGSIEEMKTAGFVDTDPEIQVAKMLLSQNPKPKEFMVYVGNEKKSLSEQLDSAKDKNAGFYYVLPTTQKPADLHVIGDWVAIQEKILIGSSSSVAALTGRNNIREAFLIHNQADKFYNSAWLGSVVTKPVGSYTWHYQTPLLVQPSNFPLMVLKEIRNKNGQTISERKGVIYVDNGITTGGQYIDIVQTRDWIKTRLEEAIFALMVRKDKIPYDDRGILMIKSEMRKVFQIAAQQGMIASVGTEADLAKSDEGKYQYKISIPSFSEQVKNDRASRKLRGVDFSFVMLGAIEKIEVNGTITV